MTAEQQRVEALGPAERLIQTITQYTDHMTHNRPGLVVSDTRQKIGVRWDPATWLIEDGIKNVYRVYKIHGKVTKTKVGVLNGTNEVKEGNRVVGTFREAGLFPEVASYLYDQISEVWKLDNEFAAKWASWAFEKEENRDLKVLLAAFLLVQNRFGEPIKDGDASFRDEDYRAVGEALCLSKPKKQGGSFNPRMLLRIGQVLRLQGIVETNRKLGFGRSQRSAALGRYALMVHKWLRHCEVNQKIFTKMVKNGFRTGIMALARSIGYKPESDKFFEILRWKQVQSKNGHRTMAVGKKVKKAKTWKGFTEVQICEDIVKEQMGYKKIVGMLPSEIGLTPAIMSAAIESGCLSDADLIILTPTLEELGLLTKADILARWQQAMDKATNQRALNIVKNVRSTVAKEGLEKAADTAMAKAVEEVMKDLRLYIVVDKSGSMQGAIEKAKEYLTRFVGSFPLDKIHVSAFNTCGVEVIIKVPTAAGVTQAFRGHQAGGGTSYSEGVRCLLNKYKPGPNEDAVILFVGDEEDNAIVALTQTISSSGVNPVALGILHVDSYQEAGVRFYGVQHQNFNLVQRAADSLGIPCFKIDESIFSDPYAVSRTMRNLIASTPVGRSSTPAPKVHRVSLIEEILLTPLLQKPVWA